MTWLDVRDAVALAMAVVFIASTARITWVDVLDRTWPGKR